MRNTGLFFGVVVLLGGLAACKVVDDDDRAAAGVDTGGGVSLSLEAPGLMRLGETSTIRISLENQADTVVRGVQAVLEVPGWMEPAPPEATGTPVTMTTAPEGGTQLLFQMADSLAPGESRTLSQRVRTSAPTAGQDPALLFRVVRARLIQPGGATLAEVESEIQVDTVAALVGPGDGVVAGDVDAVIGTGGVGRLRLGMDSAALRAAAPGARDTAWMWEGTRERGMVIPLGGSEIVGVLADGRLHRLVATGPAPRTADGLGTGSTVSELRRAYGPACAGLGEGRLAIWFPEPRGVSFGLRAPAGNAAAWAADPPQIPDSIRVASLWVHGGPAACTPRPAAGGEAEGAQ